MMHRHVPTVAQNEQTKTLTGDKAFGLVMAFGDHRRSTSTDVSTPYSKNTLGRICRAVWICQNGRKVILLRGDGVCASSTNVGCSGNKSKANIL